MAVPEALLAEARAALDQLSARAKRDFLDMWRGASNQTQLLGVVESWFPAFVGRYGTIAASLAAEVFALEAAALGISPKVSIVAPDAAEAARQGRWASGKPNAAGNLVLAVDLMVKAPYRATMQGSAHKSGAAYCRVPRNPEPCAFCFMLASRGAVYHTEATAGAKGSGNEYHGDCSCDVVLVRGPQDYPDGYDPEGYYAAYNSAAEIVGNRFDTKAILAQMREMYGFSR